MRRNSTGITTGCPASEHRSPLLNTFGILIVILILLGILPDVPHQLEFLLASVAFTATGFTLRHRLWPHMLMGSRAPVAQPASLPAAAARPGRRVGLRVRGRGSCAHAATPPRVTPPEARPVVLLHGEFLFSASFTAPICTLGPGTHWLCPGNTLPSLT